MSAPQRSSAPHDHHHDPRHASGRTGLHVPRGAVVVVVVLDASAVDRGAVCWAAETARASARPLHLVHALEEPAVAVADASGTVLVASSDQLARAVGAARARARHLVADLAPDAGVSVVTGDVLPQLVAASRSAHLMVLGDTLLRAAPPCPGQPVAAFLAMRAPCPVVVVPGADRSAREVTTPTRAMGTRRAVVVGVDGTHAGRGALELAFAQASVGGALLKVVHAWPSSGLGGEDGQVGRAERRAMVSELLAGFRERYPDVLVVTHLIRGEAVAALIGRSWRAELLVLSGCYVQGRGGLLPGAVTLAALQRARCPVAMVRDVGATDRLRPPPTRSWVPAGAPRGAGVLVRT